MLKFNLAGREIFIETQKELLGEKNSYWMAALTKLKEKSAFKVYAKSQMVDFTTTNAITAALEQYEKAVKNLSDDDQLIDEEDGHEIDVYDYIPKEYHEIYNYSKKYQGIIDAVSPHPCFVGSTKVKTDKGYKEIKDIQIGDFVLTHQNRYRRVLNLMNSKTNLITKVKIFNCEEIQCTDNHPFYAKTDDVDTPFWVNAEDLTDKHYVAMPKKVAVKQYTFNSWKDGVEHVWIKVENVEFIHKTETVYNLSVEEDTSYTANNIAVHNCAFLVTNDPITRSFGLMRVKDEIVCMVEGSVADSWKYVKNDLLSVSVYSLIGNTFARIGKPILSVSELIEATKYDEKVWKIYEEGYTMCRFMHREYVNIHVN